MDFLAITNYTGNSIEIPYCQFLFGKNLHCMAIASNLAHCTHIEDILPATEGVRYFSLGKLKEQGVTLVWEIIQILVDQQWDFDQCLNPDLVIISEKA